MGAAAKISKDLILKKPKTKNSYECADTDLSCRGKKRKICSQIFAIEILPPPPCKCFFCKYLNAKKLLLLELLPYVCMFVSCKINLFWNNVSHKASWAYILIKFLHIISSYSQCKYINIYLYTYLNLCLSSVCAHPSSSFLWEEGGPKFITCFIFHHFFISF